MKQLLAPLQKIANLIEEERKEIAEVKSYMTLNLKKASDENIKELKKQTTLLTDIKDLIKQQIQQKEDQKSGGGGGKIKMPSIMGAVGAGFAIVTMAAALVVAAGIFGIMPQVTPVQILTAIAIGAVFIILTPMFVDITKSLRGGGMASRIMGKKAGVTTGSIKDMLRDTGGTALAMIAMALGITATSWIFSAIKPISFAKFATAALIGIAFIPISFAFAQIVRGLQRARIGMDKAGFKRLAMVTVSMAAIALGLALVAHIWNTTMPSNFVKLPSLGWILKAGLIIWIFSTGFSKILRAVKGASIKEMIFATAALPLLAVALVGVAWIFQYFSEVSEWVSPPVEWTLKAGLAVLIFSIPFVLVSMVAKKIGIKGLILGALSMVAIAGVILAVGWIFSYLEGISYVSPPLEWAVGAAIAITIFAIPLALLGLLATSGIGAVGILLGAAAIILIAASIWVVAWIFSKLPDLGAISKNFTNALMTPVNAMIDALVRFKEQIGIENMLPLAGGLLAIAGGWLALTAALAGSSIGGLIGAAAGVGKAIFDGFAKFFGGKAAETPLSILDKLISRKEGIIALANPVKILGTEFAKISNNTKAVIAGIGAMLKLADKKTREELEKSNNAIAGIALAYSRIASASVFMNVTAINATTKMFKAIASKAEMVVRGVTAFTMFFDVNKASIFEKSATAAEKLAKAYSSIAASSKIMNIPALQASSRMFEAIAKIAENNGQDAITELSKSLLAAVKELSETVKNLEATTAGQQEGIGDAISGAISSFIDKIKGKTDEAGKESGLIDIEPIVLAIQELEERFDRAIKVVPVS